MREDNYQLFNEAVDPTLIDKMTLNPEKEKWPEELRELYFVLEEKVKELGLSPAFALPLLSAVTESIGGGQVYFPRGEVIKRQIRDIQIWKMFNGHNIKALSRRFNVSHKTIYEAIARMRKAEIQKYQRDLFD